MQEARPCLICNKASGFVYPSTMSPVLSGAYGSVDYDATYLVWLGQAPKFESADEGYCDACTTSLIEEGKLEPVIAHIGKPLENHLSEEAYRKTFLWGASYAKRQLAQGRQNVIPEGEANKDAILSLRRSLTDDPSELGCQAHHKPTTRDTQYGLLARDTGHAHVIAAAALGYANAESSFEDAADDFAKSMTNFQKDMIVLSEEITRAFDELEVETLGKTQAEQ